MLDRFWLAFLPLFVAVDPLAVVPLFWGIGQSLTPPQRRQAIHQAALVAWLAGLTFLVVSGWVFEALGISMGDVLIAGGVTLFVLSLNELARFTPTLYQAVQDIGIVPLGVPLIVGPAVLTTLLLTREHHGVWLTAMAFNVNILLAWGLLLGAESVARWMGPGGAKVVSKVMNLILAAFAVKLVRQGLSVWFAPQ